MEANGVMIVPPKREQIHEVETNVKDDALLMRGRAALVEAAASLILRQGFHATSVSDIAKAAGMTKGNVYNYVGSKEDVLYLICREAVAAYTQDVLTAIEAGASAASRLELAVAATVRSIERHRKLILIVYRESHSLGFKARKVIVDIANGFAVLITRLVAEAQQDGYGVTGSAEIAADVIIHTATIFALRGWSLKHADKAETLDFVIRFIVAGLRS